MSTTKQQVNIHKAINEASYAAIRSERVARTISSEQALSCFMGTFVCDAMPTNTDNTLFRSGGNAMPVLEINDLPEIEGR